MGSINTQISRYETSAVYTHPDAKVDVILVHGLNGDPEKTWSAKNGVFWPADLLPASLRHARANILVYGYNADVYSKKHDSSPSDNYIYMHAQTLVTSLTHYRKDELTSFNPIIWVCHSLGGILVKRALLYSNDLRTSQLRDYRSIYVSTYGMIFLGTPHSGSDIATWGTVLQAMSDAVIPRSFFQSESVLLKTLKRDNETLQNINSHFLDIYQRFKIIMAHENHKTDFKGTKTLVVDANSAGPQLPGVTYYAIEATHSGMCKFDSKNAPGYRTIATAVREWVLDAPDVIATRWRVEKEDEFARDKQELEERMKPWIQAQRLQTSHGTSTAQQNNESILSPSQGQARIQHPSRPLLPEPETPSLSDEEEEVFYSQESADNNPTRDPILVKPPVFRPNTYFKGREKELKLLHKMLMDRKIRSVGTSSVLIQSMPGGGKSHLARQYVFEYRDDYPNGIFWICSKTLQDLEFGYNDIARVAGLSEASMTDQDTSTSPSVVVKAVQAWLSSTTDWLLVLDGIHFDFEGIHNFIPFAKNTSIIYTSTERTIDEEYQFDNPQVMALDPLTKREAQDLLFEEMGKKPPYTHDDLQRAEELVELMDRLPLMIHVAALQLKATREPLAKYLRSYKSRPKVGNLPAYRAVHEQLEHRGAVAALNLMSLLAFFGTQIPVEMISLGAKALDKRTPLKSRGPESQRKSLNLTFSILISFALIERNEAKKSSSETTRSTRSADMNQDNLDIIRIRGIVQAFFVDVLTERREVNFWLERAISAYCGAFDASIHRVDNDSQIGVPDDYRQFLIHGRRLLAHLDRFEKRFPVLKPCREKLVSRLNSIQNRIDQLAKRVSEATSQGSADALVSVFERTNSISESDSSRSSPSLIDYAMSDGTDALESPSVHSPTEQGPYHWHIPAGYDHKHVEWETSRTVTPQPEPTEIFESMSMPDDDEMTKQVFGPHHRTIKKQASRRYRDHAGAWRASSQNASDPRDPRDPRVTMSRETVRGLINHSLPQRQSEHLSSSDSGPSAPSEAELILNQISRASPKPIDDSVDLTRSISLPARRRRLLGSFSYANPKTEETREDVTPTFSYPPTYRDVATVIMRQKETDRVLRHSTVPIQVSSPLAVVQKNPEATSVPASHTGGQITGEDMVASLESLEIMSESSSRTHSRPRSHRSLTVAPRSTRSSPSPMRSAAFAPPPISIEVNKTSSLHSVPSEIFRPVNNHRLSAHSARDDNELPRTSSSSPTPALKPHPNLPYPFMIPTPIRPFDESSPPAPWAPSHPGLSNLHPDGYSSQPMSRNTSHQSNTSVGSNHSLPAPRGTSPNFSNRALSSSPGSQIMQIPQARRPSVVETEPSPRLHPFEPDTVTTSYQLYKNSWATAAAASKRKSRSRRQGRSPSPDSFNTTGSKSKWLSRFRSMKSRNTDGGLKRTQSQPVGRPSTNQPARRGRQGRLDAERSPPRRSNAGEHMAHNGSVSGSGGIKLADDTIVEFGSSPSRAAAVIAEAKRRSPRPGGASPLSARPLSLSRAETAGPTSGGSPPGSVGLGIRQRV